MTLSARWKQADFGMCGMPRFGWRRTGCPGGGRSSAGVAPESPRGLQRPGGFRRAGSVASTERVHVLKIEVLRLTPARRGAQRGSDKRKAGNRPHKSVEEHVSSSMALERVAPSKRADGLAARDKCLCVVARQQGVADFQLVSLFFNISYATKEHEPRASRAFRACKSHNWLRRD